MSAAGVDVVVVGAGVAGLTAALDLARAGQDVLVLEGAPTLGGKLRLGEVAGVPVDVGAEAMLARRPEGLALAADLGLDVVHPTAAASRVWSRGALRPLPRSLMGVPLDLDELADSGVLSDEGLARVRVEVMTAVDDDVSVGDLVGARLGDELVDRLVEPLLGGVYAGHARALSCAAAAPGLLAMARRGSLLGQAGSAATGSGPVFASLPGGMGRLPGALARALADTGRGQVRTGAMVRGLARDAGGWVLTVGETRASEAVRAEQVVLATPATPTARLLDGVAPAASAALAGIEHASTALVSLAVPAHQVADRLDDCSGFLVPPVEGRGIKAATFSFAKWDWVRELDPDVLVLRTSWGRAGDTSALQVSDDVLVERSVADLSAATGLALAPVDRHVQRWGGGLPQYAVGHLDLVAGVRADLPAGVAVCGAAYDGVGVPAVVGSARRAVASLTQAE